MGVGRDVINLDLEVILKEGDWVDWCLLVNEYDVFAVMMGFGAREVENT